MAIIKKSMGKPMKKAQNGTVTKKKPARTVSGIISEDGDMADDLNDYLRAKAKGEIPLDPTIQRGIKNGTLNPDGTIKKPTQRGSESNMSRTPMKKGGMIKKAKNGASLKPVPAGKKGLAKLPTPVRNKMGFQKNGGKVKK
jgi:hypothetical protein